VLGRRDELHSGANANMRAVLIGLVNAILPGVGYVILRKRVIFGALVLASTILWIISGFFETYAESFFIASTLNGRIFEAFAYVVLFAAFGYDAYSLAKE
jgi:hypothetical protein